MRSEKKNGHSTTYSNSATPTDTSFSNVKSFSFAGSPLLFKSPFRQSNMFAVEGSSIVTVTGSESGQ